MLTYAGFNAPLTGVVFALEILLPSLYAADIAVAGQIAKEEEETSKQVRMLTYADVCGRMLTYADVCWRLRKKLASRYRRSGMLTYADVC
jgi:hypothetical protein